MNNDTIAFYYMLITFCYNTPDRYGDANAHYINSVLYTLHLILLYINKVNISRQLAFVYIMIPDRGCTPQGHTICRTCFIPPLEFFLFFLLPVWILLLKFGKKFKFCRFGWLFLCWLCLVASMWFTSICDL